MSGEHSDKANEDCHPNKELTEKITLRAIVTDDPEQKFYKSMIKTV